MNQINTAIASALLLAAPAPSIARAEPLRVNEGESIVIIGNTFAERMHLFGYFETFLHSKFPDHKLKIRNMGWSADELTLMPRPAGFGDVHKYLTQEKADVIFACFGMNESFQGPEGIKRFKQDLDAFLSGLSEHQYNGRSAPRIVLVSPIAHENLGGNMPDGKEHNRNLALYVQAMAAAARRHNVTFVDLFAPTRKWMSSPSAKKLTCLTNNSSTARTYPAAVPSAPSLLHALASRRSMSATPCCRCIPFANRPAVAIRCEW